MLYDNAGQVSSLTHSSPASTLMAYGVTRDTRGNPTKVTTTTSGATTTALYGYDTLSRLTSECYPTSSTSCTSTSKRLSYTYNNVGNRQTQTVRTGSNTVTTNYTYDNADQMLSQAVAGTPTVTNTWTPNGALATSTTPSGTTTFTTDLTDELVSAVLENGSSVSYTHDTKGNRTSRTVGGVTNATWAWDELSSLPTRIGEYSASGSLTSSWLPDQTSSTGAALGERSGTSSSWLLGDSFGNITAAASTNGSSVTGTRPLNAFGSARAAATGSLAGSAIGFEGQYLDSAIGLYDMRARDYDPGSGRFTANDPVAVPSGMPYVTGYSYSFNNPLTSSDTSGNWPTFDDEQLEKFWGAPALVVGGIVRGIPYSLSVEGVQERIDNFGKVYELGGGGWSGAYDSFNVNLNPGYEIVSGTVGAYEACVAGKPGDAAIEGFSAVLAAGLTATALGKIRPGGGKTGTDTEGPLVDPAKFDFLFGRVTSGEHNTNRSVQIGNQLNRVGVYDNAAGRALLMDHFKDVIARSDNIAKTIATEYGTAQIRESMFVGPTGLVKFVSTWMVTDEGLRLSTIIPVGRK